MRWLRRSREYNVCDCGAQIEGNAKVCAKCSKAGSNMAQAYRCDKGHIFLVITFPTGPAMPKSPTFYEAKACPVCLSEKITKQDTKRR